MPREGELKAALEHAEAVETGRYIPGEEEEAQYGPAYWKSVEDIRAKYELIQQAKEVKEHPERWKVPEGYEER
ncbi:hypothetical protein KKA24_02170, partial [Patescibacteria group bacterium]|nr:hypothetical protein [Patescibacteria group bacterium]